MPSQIIKLTVQLKAHVIEAAFALKVFLQTNYAYIKKISDQTRRVMNHIIFINLNRLRLNHLEEVEVKDILNTLWLKLYEVEKLINRRTKNYKKQQIIQYLLR